MESITVKKLLFKLIRGLNYSSESDYPFTLLDWGSKDEKGVMEAVTALSENPEPLEKLHAGDFFSKCIKNLKLGGGEQAKRSVLQYEKLQSFISRNAESCMVWRCGKIQVGLFIVIRLKGGHVFALKTVSIET